MKVTIAPSEYNPTQLTPVKIEVGESDMMPHLALAALLEKAYHQQRDLRVVARTAKIISADGLEDWEPLAQRIKRYEAIVQQLAQGQEGERPVILEGFDAQYGYEAVMAGIGSMALKDGGEAGSDTDTDGVVDRSLAKISYYDINGTPLAQMKPGAETE